MKTSRRSSLVRAIRFVAIVAIALTGLFSAVARAADKNAAHAAERAIPAAAPAVLYGDGINDDTAAIQAMLDSGTTLVRLPPPAKNYLISKALRIHSNQTLQLDRGAVIRLADKSCDYMVVNADPDKGNADIAILGGIWDHNNVSNPARKGPRNDRHPHSFFIGSTMLLMNVRNLTIDGLTIKDPQKFGIHVAACRKFTVNDIILDYNAKSGNMDGVHLQGGCSEGRVTNIKGNTYDDMVALNSDDGEYWEVTRGPITDIQIDGIYADNCFRAVRFLSAKSSIKRISINNIQGSFFMNTVAFTHWGFPVAADAVYEDISISNIQTAKATDAHLKMYRGNFRRAFSIIGIEGKIRVDNLSITNLSRHEWFPNAAPTINIQRGAKIGTLRLRDIHQVNMANNSLVFFRNDATISRLYLDNILLREKNGSHRHIPFQGSGKILKQHGNIDTETQQEFLELEKEIDADLEANPPPDTRL